MFVFLLLQLPYFSGIQYPFRLLGTWFHEMGHGLTAILTGGDFHYLEIYKNGGGVAHSSVTNSIFSIATARALVAAGGLLGPAISGSVLIISAKKIKHASVMLRVLTGMIVLSLLLWIRSFWGVITLGGFSVLFVLIIFLKNKKLENSIVLFLGLQCVFSTYLQLGYLFTKQFERQGQLMNSDTYAIAINSFGTYWMWAIIMVVISVIMLWKSVSYYLKK